MDFVALAATLTPGDLEVNLIDEDPTDNGEVIAQHRSGERQSANAITPAKRRDFLCWYFDPNAYLPDHLLRQRGQDTAALRPQ